jgi:hypothetical protein
LENTERLNRVRESIEHRENVVVRIGSEIIDSKKSIESEGTTKQRMRRKKRSKKREREKDT